jgi:hypothetical protein
VVGERERPALAEVLVEPLDPGDVAEGFALLEVDHVAVAPPRAVPVPLVGRERDELAGVVVFGRGRLEALPPLEELRTVPHGLLAHSPVAPLAVPLEGVTEHRVDVEVLFRVRELLVELPGNMCLWKSPQGSS